MPIVDIETIQPQLPQNIVPNVGMMSAGNGASPSLGDRIDDNLRKSGKYEVDDDSDFTVHIYLKKNDGRWLIMNGPGPGIESHEVVFRMWTYDEMVEIRKLATSYDLRKRIHEIDNDLLNRLKIQRLLKSWTFGRENIRLELHHVGGVMTDEGWHAFTRLQPNIAQYIIDEMNAVYEYNH